MPEPRKHLFIIEDAEDNLEVLRRMLEDEFDVTTFRSCAQALSGLEDLKPDLLLMDIRMPDVDGIDCLRRIRSISGLSETPAIAITALAYAEDKAQFVAAGFQAVVVKPVMDQMKLRRLIRDTIS